MEKEEKKALELYLKEANAFNESEKENFKKSEKTAWRVAKASWALLGLCLLVLYGLVPLKQTVQQILVVDKSTGMTEPLQTVAQVQKSLPEVFHNANLNTFILARENYTYETAETNYFTAAAFMSPQLQQEWANYWDQNNPNNPITRYKNGKVKIDVLSITLKPKESGRLEVATIRFKKMADTGGSTPTESHWVATITYRLVEEPKDIKVARINPLGFQVTHYQTDPELIPTASLPPAPTVKPNSGPTQ